MQRVTRSRSALLFTTCIKKRIKMEKEIWKSVPGFNGMYLVSNLGNLKSLYSNRLLKKHFNHDGYVKYYMSVDSKNKRYFAHRIVAITFLDNDLNLETVNHKNGIKHDNRVENLEWMSLRDNIIHSYKTGLACNKKENHPMWGKKHSEKSIEKIKETRKRNNVYQYKLDGSLVAKHESYTVAAKQFNGSAGCISNCIKGKQKTAYGYIWKLYSETKTNTIKII